MTEAECTHDWYEFESSWWYFCTRRCTKCNAKEGYGPWVKRTVFTRDEFMGPPPRVRPTPPEGEEP